MSRVISALEALHANLPPTLSKSQVSSVRKHLKLQLFLLCKHPIALGYAPQLITLLSDLGATPHEMAKQLPPKFIEGEPQFIEWCLPQRSAVHFSNTLDVLLMLPLRFQLNNFAHVRSVRYEAL